MPAKQIKGYRYQNRKEMVYRFNGSIPEETFCSYNVLKFPNKYVTTIYFGGKSRLWSGIKLLSHVAIKTRYYTQYPSKNIFVPLSNQPCILEIKRRFEGESNSNYRTKVRINNSFYDKSVKSSLSFGDITKILLNKENLASYKNVLNDAFINELNCIFDEYKLTSLEPIAATSYARDHFENDTERITIDSGLKYYLSTTHEEDTVFKCVKEIEDKVIEIKSNSEDSSFIDKISSTGIKTTPVMGSETKGATLYNLVKNKKIVFIEPELDLRDETDWTITEREAKIDIGSDPRSIITGDTLIQFEDGFVSGNPKSINTYLKFYIAGKEGVCTMQWKPDDDSKRSLKYKTTISNYDNVLVRKEVVEPFSKTKLMNILKKLQNGFEYIIPKVTPMIDRARTSFSVYFIDTSHVFRIYNDHCMVDEPSYSNLDQIEIEYEGTIKEKNEKNGKQEIEEISREIIFLSQKIMTFLNKSGIKYKFPGTTKYEWIKKEYSSVDLKD